ncbi:tetratricopeptide repeat protein [Streptomyces albofaciens JCM 4342]|uniref:ATP-binding protein n=1 Tax=Streptomyces albofaciens TaxID=66866 RepID=UPI00123B66DA|nr:tetratricopeptide repeat protein [Streptomyces albofaciens]KAA6223629.1 tetratricopeptide repeat protein [Streptomyces albofaciens JCM 4342]
MTTEHDASNRDRSPLAADVRNVVSAPVEGHVVQAGVVHGDVHLHPARERGPVPHQLPAAPSRFTGRAGELAALTAALDEAVESGTTVTISAIGGAGGIGKTWLALYWAHRHADRFPDGRLFVDMRGFTPLGEPMPTAEAVRGFLNALGVDPSGVPPDLDAQVGLYRSLVAERRMLIVLDNVRDTAHVAPLLPGSATCTVLVTSRRHLAGLVTTHGARSLDLDVLSEAEARQLLVDHLGAERVAAEPEAVREFLACCAGLPLALSIVAARATAHPGFPLSVLAEELRDHTTRLDELDAGEIPLNLRAAFSSSYHALSPEAAVLLGLLGLAPGPDISLPAAASLAGLPKARVRALLRELETAHLVSQPAPGRYRLHDLIRLYACDQAHRHQAEGRRDGALRRLVEFYLHTAYAADQLLDPHRESVVLDPPAEGCLSHPLPDEAGALAWLDAEHPCVMAAQRLAVERQWHTLVWQLAPTLHTYHWRRGRLPDQVAVARAGLTAALCLGDPAIEAPAHRLLAESCALAGRHTEALEHLNEALTLAESSHDLPSQAHTHRVLGWAWGQQGRIGPALDHATRSLGLFQTIGDEEWEARGLNQSAWYSAQLGHYEQAAAYGDKALLLHRRHGNGNGEALSLSVHAYLGLRTGRYTDVLENGRRALTLFREIGNTFHEALLLEGIGQAHAALGQAAEAGEAWRQALELYRTQHRTEEAERLQRRLAEAAERVPEGADGSALSDGAPPRST